jgi:tRNA pseudouridine38-40 synthase
VSLQHLQQLPRSVHYFYTLMMQRYFLEVMYDGTAFHGSQLQGEIPTVQLSLNKAVSTLLRTQITTFGASRTDEGVHACSNFYHFDTDAELHPHFHYKINALLPPALAVKRIFICIGEPINARFDAISRRYRYRIYADRNPFLHNRALYYPFKLDRKLLDETAPILREYQNFESFSKRNSQTKTFLCDIREAYWEEEGNELMFVVKANRFLRGMVRALVSTQLQVARGRIPVDGFRQIIEARDCTKADFSVTGHGLYLEEIAYPEGKLQEMFLK